MPGFKWLPSVGNAFIYCDVRTGALFIAIYTVIRCSFPAVNLTCPVCSNFHLWTGMAMILSILNVLVFFASLALFIATLALLFTLCVELEIVKPYVIAMYVFIVLTIIYHVAIVIYAVSEEEACESSNCWRSLQDKEEQENIPKAKPRTWERGILETVYYLFLHIIECVLLFYFTLVVNSFEHDPEAYPGPHSTMIRTLSDSDKKHSPRASFESDSSEV